MAFEIVFEAKKWKTGLARLKHVADNIAELEKFEAKGIQPLAKPLSEMKRMHDQARETIISEGIKDVYEEARAKAQLATTTAGKVGAVNKGILELRELSQETGRHQVLEKAAAQLKAYAHHLQFKAMIDDGEKAEFKGNLKKALDQYQEALFFVMKDDIPDSEQAGLIEKLKRKVEQLKTTQADAEATKKTRKG
jgi:hypothetical protein